MVQSHQVTEKQWTLIQMLKPNLNGQKVLVRGHLQTVRDVGKGAFI
jgi:hypothetical protein